MLWALQRMGCGQFLQPWQIQKMLQISGRLVERITEIKTGMIQNEKFLTNAYHMALIPGILSILSGCINIIVDGILVGNQIGAGGTGRSELLCPGISSALHCRFLSGVWGGNLLLQGNRE